MLILRSTLWRLELPNVFPFCERSQTKNGTTQKEERFKNVRKTKCKITQKNVKSSSGVRLSICVMHINTDHITSYSQVAEATELGQTL